MGMLEGARGEPQTLGLVLPAAAGSGNGKLGDWRNPRWNFCTRNQPQFHNNSTIAKFHPSLGHGHSVTGASTALGMSPLGKKCFPPSLLFLERLGRGGKREAPAAAGSTQPFILLAGPAAITSQLTKLLPLLSAPSPPRGASARSTLEPRAGRAGREGWIPAGAALGCREWGAGVHPAFPELWELLPLRPPRVWGLETGLEMIQDCP